MKMNKIDASEVACAAYFAFILFVVLALYSTLIPHVGPVAVR